MFSRQLAKKSVAFSLSAALAIPGVLGDQTAPRPIAQQQHELVTRDVAISDSGRVSVQLLTSASTGIAKTHVSLLHAGQVVATAVTDQDGRVEFSGVRPGEHLIQVGRAVQPVRFWAAQNAPPAAVNNLAVVASDDVVRGQFGLVNTDPVGSTPLMSFSGLQISPTMIGLSAFGIASIISNIENRNDIKYLQSQINQLSSP